MRRVLIAGALILMPTLGGCGNELCACSESPQVTRSVAGPARYHEIVPNAQGPGEADIHLTLPARMNASVCVC